MDPGKELVMKTWDPESQGSFFPVGWDGGVGVLVMQILLWRYLLGGLCWKSILDPLNAATGTVLADRVFVPLCWLTA